MKLSVALLAAAIAAPLASAFVPQPGTSASAIRSPSTELYISSWGVNGPPHRRQAEEEPNPAEKIQAYLKAPEPIAARDGLDGTVLVSGWVNSSERTDQFVFDMLNHEEAAFRFAKIVAFVDDEKFAKKRLIGRNARYTGLLDKLDIVEATGPGALPTKEQLAGVKHWVASVGNSLDAVKEIGDLVRSTDVENVSILLTDASSVTADAAKDVVEALTLDGDDKSYTLVAVGALKDTPEGSTPYSIDDMGTVNGTISEDETFSRDESIRLVTECLGLESGRNKALTFKECTDVNATEFKLVKGLREGGYSRPQEIDHMITKGPSAYIEACEQWTTKAPKRTQFDEWMKGEEEKLKVESAEAVQRKEKEREEARTQETEDIAREWAKRDFFRKGMSGEISDMTEEEYIESIWDRALFEGDLVWRQLNGVETNEEEELRDFKSKQEKKKQAMLERAKASLAELLDEDTVGAGKKDSDDDE
eukprot:CAMPEP_0178503270 /NCGR_PEP_ID=MMETSP0696-20121128/17952_1 /TAXON_ID=265572 /ORGANISM="Extubocellulus spinifer, Strain CCMP396" /LENGTH=476 /DNA_ID=CAMNT_0020132391 /DNA_START=93 /DNA_END=1523 /DNA_ORIENTATION=-